MEGGECFHPSLKGQSGEEFPEPIWELQAERVAGQSYCRPVGQSPGQEWVERHGDSMFPRMIRGTLSACDNN